MFEKMKSLLGMDRAPERSEEEPREGTEEYGDLSKLMKFAKDDFRTELQKEKERTQFSDKRFIVTGKVRNVMDAAGVIIVFIGPCMFCFNREWESELLKIGREQIVTIDGLYEKITHNDIHFEDCRLVKEEDERQD